MFAIVHSAAFVLMGPSRLGCTKIHYHPKDMGNAHIPFQFHGLLTVCPIMPPIQVNWKPDFQAAAGKVRILDVQSSPYQEETENWVFLLTLC